MGLKLLEMFADNIIAFVIDSTFPKALILKVIVDQFDLSENVVKNGFIY